MDSVDCGTVPIHEDFIRVCLCLCPLTGALSPQEVPLGRKSFDSRFQSQHMMPFIDELYTEKIETQSFTPQSLCKEQSPKVNKTYETVGEGTFQYS